MSTPRFFPTTQRPAPLAGLSVSPERKHLSDGAWLLVCLTCLTGGGYLGWLTSSFLHLHGL